MSEDAESRMARLTVLARKAWPSRKRPLSVYIGPGGALACESPADELDDEHCVLLHHPDAGRFEAALIALIGYSCRESDDKPTRDDLTSDQLRELDDEWAGVPKRDVAARLVQVGRELESLEFGRNRLDRRRRILLVALADKTKKKRTA